MKKGLSLILIATLLLGMSACGKREEEPSFSRPIGESASPQGGSNINIYDLPEEEGAIRDQGPAAEEEEESAGGSVAVTEETADQVPRLDLIPCREKKDIQWTDARFYQKANDLYLRFSLPQDWVLKPMEDGSYEVWRAENQIGWISAKPMKETTRYMQRVDVTWQDDPDLLADVSVSWNHRANLKEVYRDIKIHGKKDGAAFALNIRVLYGELDDEAEETIFSGIHKTKKEIDLSMEPITDGNGSKKILIVGDEAMAASQVDVFLRDLLAGSGYTAEMVTVDQPGIKNVPFHSDFNAKLLNKEYNYLFLGGFYDDVDISTLSNTLTLCTRSNTKVALFPSCGENRLAIDAAKRIYEGERFLDWKAELEELMGRGVAKSQFQTENAKSTLLAGYVGAHMIYRNLFGKTPPALQNAPLSMAEITAALGNYPQTDHTADRLAEYTF